MESRIDTPIRTTKLKNKVLSFFKEEYTPFTSLTKDILNQETDGASSPLSTGDLRIGIDYNDLTSFEQYYVFSIQRWICVQAGKRKRTFKREYEKEYNLKMLTGAIPYYNCMEEDAVPAMDAFLPFSRSKIEAPNDTKDNVVEKMEEIVLAELHRLERLWRKLPKTKGER